MNNLIVFATYWNEAQWIEASLQQILKIDPIEIIICDGNFDPRVSNYSTDGTREIINKFVSENSDRALLISAERKHSLFRGINFFTDAGLDGESIPPIRLRYSVASQLIIHEYRVNQALTFSKMMNLSKRWKRGRWVMTLDADQFYSDQVIEAFEVTNDRASNLGIITADELTFPDNFNYFSSEYEFRTWNNMPHKIVGNMAVYPTRHFVMENKFSFEHIHEFAPALHAGTYHHYKFREDQSRLDAGYKLGDRQPPSPHRFAALQPFDGKHPAVIRENFGV